MKKVTLKDIANELNVTVGTVSHVLNGRDDISEETKKRVTEAAKKMGYVSNSAAVALRLGKTHTIAIIVPDISNPHIAYQVKLIEKKMKMRKYSVIILNTDENEEAEYEAVVTACAKQVDGILICPSQRGRKSIDFIKQMNIPYVLIGRYYENYDEDYVCADDVKGGRMAGEYLLKKGCKRPMYFGAYRYIEASVKRYEGLSEVFGEQVEFKDISPNKNDFFNAAAIVTEKMCDSVVAFSDLLAYKIISELNAAAISVPVIGFDAINRHLNIPFNGVSVGMKGGWGDKAADILIKKIKGSRERFCEIIDVELYEFT